MNSSDAIDTLTRWLDAVNVATAGTRTSRIVDAHFAREAKRSESQAVDNDGIADGVTCPSRGGPRCRRPLSRATDSSRVCSWQRGRSRVRAGYVDCTRRSDTTGGVPHASYCSPGRIVSITSTS